MASSLLTTDKRWAAPTRKSGMTVLGKIPKPINLPSQRLENHGLDPNVEIVPKGTLTWGSKTGPTTPNAWSSTSLLSPKKDGSSGAPSHISGRPSSGGGSRPSTAGSESLDSPNAWGPNSRPSSASGTLPSHHLPVVTNRPRSAETRPGSSQLSRFADNPSENMNVLIKIIDKSGSSSHGHGFNLSTGDFPTLGSEKSSESNSQRGHSSKGRPTSSSGKEGAQNDLGKSLTTGHSLKGRPTSSSGKEGAQNDLGKSLTTGSGEVILSANSQHVDIMKTGQHSHDGGAPFPATGPPNEVQQPQPYPPNFCMPPPQFDSWRAPPGHPPEGMWHRGPAAGGAFRPASPGSFPVEPFTYCGQFPPNSEAARQSSGHGGYHPKNGDAYHTMPPNSYIMNQPVISVRPVYQGPMPYDGYYGPQRANFNNVNVRDSPFIGGPHQPGILNQFPNQNDKFQPGHSQSRPVKHEAVPKQQSESDRLHVVCRGQPMILHDNPALLGGPLEVERKTEPAPPLLPHPNGNWNNMNMREGTRDTCSERNMVLMNSVPDQRGPAGTSHSSILENAHSHTRETDDATLRKKFKDDNVTFDQQPVIKKNSALIEKIGSLNNKARSVDARNVAEPFSTKEAKEKQQKNTDSKADKVIKDVSSDVAVVGPLHSHLSEVSKAGKLGELTHDRTRKRGDFSRNSHNGPTKDMPANNFTGHGRNGNSKIESLPVVQLRNSQHDQPSDHVSQFPPVTITDDMPATTEYDPQRAKMRELAVQRAKKLQAEEEERTKQQKAKALAKLEELNRRSSVHQKNSNDPPLEIDDVHNNKEKAGLVATTKPATSTAESRDVTASDNLSTLQPPNDPKDTAVPVQSKSTALPHAGGTGKESAVHSTSSSGRNTQSNRMEHVAQKSISQSHDVGVPKPRQGYRRRHAVSEEKIPGEKSSVAVSTDNVKKTVEASLDTTAVVTLHDEPLAHKKSARNSRSKKKVDDAPGTSKYPPVVLNEQKLASISNEPKTQTAGVIISSSIVPTEGTMLTVGSITVGGISFGSLNQYSVQSPEEVHNTANIRPRPPQAKRSGKNQHAVRPVEKLHGNEGVVWAPVKPSGQNEQSEEAMLNTAVAASTQVVGKNTNDGENVTRTKRAEMERYVPKPLSKELQQQNLEQSLLPVENKSNDKEAAEKLAATATEPKKWEDKKTSRGHGKSHSSWRRRNTDESALVVPNPAEHADNCQESPEVQKPSDQHQPLEPDEQADYASGNSSAPTQTIPLPVSATKEHGAANRQRRQHVKAPKNMGSNYSSENKDREGRKEAHQMSTVGMDSDSSEHRNVSRHEVKSSGAVAHSRAHWKPKTSHSQNNPQSNNTAEGQVDNATLHDSGNSNLTPNSNVNNEKDAQSEQGKGDMTHGDDNQKSESHENAEQQQLNPAPRRQSHHNGRYHRGSGTHRGRGYEAGKPSHNSNAERRKGGTHLEYQPVGSYNKPVDFQQNSSVDERSMGPPAPGHAYRERGHNRGTRPAGPVVKRNPASAPAANSYRDE